MSNRRQFLRTLFTAAAAAPVLGKVLANLPERSVIINPAWKTATREVHFAFNPASYCGEWEWHNYPDGIAFALDDKPLRFSS